MLAQVNPSIEFGPVSQFWFECTPEETEERGGGVRSERFKSVGQAEGLTNVLSHAWIFSTVCIPRLTDDFFNIKTTYGRGSTIKRQIQAGSKVILAIEWLALNQQRR